MEYLPNSEEDRTPIHPLDAFRYGLQEEVANRPDIRRGNLGASVEVDISRLVITDMLDTESDGSRLRLAQDRALHAAEGVTSPELAGRYDELRLMARLLEGNADERTIEQLRAEYHEAVVKQLKGHLDNYDAIWRHTDMSNTSPFARPDYTWAVGGISQCAVLASITRLRSPRILAMSAVRGIERGRNDHDNVDMIVARTYDSGGATRELVQVKTRCLNDCGDGMENDERAAKRQDTLRRISPRNIALSGSCDLFMHGIHRNKPGATIVPLLLYKEVSGTATPQEISMLDLISDRLTDRLDDRGRHGTAGLELEEVPEADSIEPAMGSSTIRHLGRVSQLPMPGDGFAAPVAS